MDQCNDIEDITHKILNKFSHLPISSVQRYLIKQKVSKLGKKFNRK